MRISLIALLTLTLGISFGQDVAIETYIQESRIGLQKGYGIHYINDRGWGAGVIFQSTRNLSNELSENNYPLVGVEVRVPIQTCNRLKLQFTPKIGFVNRDFFVVLPEVQTEYEMTQHISLGLGAGIRVRESAISLKVSYRPFNQNKR